MAFRPDTPSSATPAAGEGIQNTPDKYIWGVYGCIVVLSIIELYSASSFEISKQGLYAPLLRHVGFLFVGFLIMLGLQRVHYKYFAPASKLLCLASCLAMVYVMFFGEYVNGARRAINLGFMSLQPAEFIKLSAVLMLALILGTSQLKKDESLRNAGLIKSVVLVIILSILLFSQGLTNTLILVVISFGMFILGALEWKKFLIILIVYGLMGGVAFGVKKMMTKKESTEVEVPILVDSRGKSFEVPQVNLRGGDSRLTDETWANRMLSFLDSTPRYERPITAKNLQEMRSYMAQAHGGWTGVMPGNSRETSRLPLAFSDFIFAIIVEDLGFIGGMFVMLLYLWLLARAYFIAYGCNQMYPAFLVTGCALLITTQALCHMAIVSGAGPVSGQPLPLFSKGGTSIIVTSIAFGIMLSVSRFTLRDSDATASEKALERNALPEELQAENVSQI